MVNANEAKRVVLEQFASARVRGTAAGELLRSGVATTLATEGLTP
jgi:hypothetical protein